MGNKRGVRYDFSIIVKVLKNRYPLFTVLFAWKLWQRWWTSRVIDRQINYARKLLCCIEQITEIASSTPIQKGVDTFLIVAKCKIEI
jgi:hypothetical protein